MAVVPVYAAGATLVEVICCFALDIAEVVIAAEVGASCAPEDEV